MANAPFLRTKELARRWGVSVSILKQWRIKGKGPDFHKIPGGIRYYVTDIEQYEKASRMKHTSMYVK